MSFVIEIAKVCADGKMLIFGKFDGYILSSMGSRSVPVDRLAGWQTKHDLV